MVLLMVRPNQVHCSLFSDKWLHRVCETHGAHSSEFQVPTLPWPWPQKKLLVFATAVAGLCSLLSSLLLLLLLLQLQLLPGLLVLGVIGFWVLFPFA